MKGFKNKNQEGFRQKENTEKDNAVIANQSLEEKVDVESVNPLINKRIIVRHINQRTIVTDKRNPLFGGMSEDSIRVLCVPLQANGAYVEILTDKERNFLEEILGLEYGEMSAYKRENNFWDSSYTRGINKVELTKQDVYLDLSNPEEFIKYKILLANKSIICKSLKDLEDSPRETYEYVIITPDEEIAKDKVKMNDTMRCYREFGKIEDDKDKLHYLVETLEKRSVNYESKLEFYHTRCNELIQLNPKLFLRAITDELLDTKVFIRKCIRNRSISALGNFFYLASDKSPLCEVGEEPTFNNAAKYLASPKQIELRTILENKL